MKTLLEKTQNIRAIGLMSGTSLDGLDIAYCQFSLENDQWTYQINQAETIPYSQWWQKRLAGLTAASAEELAKTHADFGHHCAREVQLFLERNQIKELDLIASHGHTIFHNPNQQYTYQIGEASVINCVTGVPTVSDFRIKDIALGGQGAPLVPIGDRYLFGQYQSCVNLGGFANISYEKNNARIAYDCCPLNIVINHFAKKCDVDFDEDGVIARDSDIDGDLLLRLNSLQYYQQAPPKSLGKEWVDSFVLPIIQASEVNPKVAIATFTEHAAFIIASQLIPGRNLFTGGGTFNKFLIDRIEHLSTTDKKIIIPNDFEICFKEALIFAFLGCLKLMGKPNVLKSVTGAKIDHSSGAIYL